MNPVFNKQSSLYLKGLAIIGVVMVHVATQQPTPPNILSKIWPLFFENGHLGVNIFFILSAYGLCFSINNCSIGEFYKKRFVRIWPMYPVALITRYVVNGLTFQESVYRFASEISGVFLFQVKRDFFWFMGVLTILYIAFPLIYKLSYATRKYKLPILFILCLIGWLSLSYDFGGNDIYLLSITRLPSIYIGIFTYLCERDFKKDEFCIGYGACALLSLTQIHNDMTCLFMPVTMLIIAQIQNRPFDKIITFLGKHTLEIYLGHTFAVYHILRFPFCYPVNIISFFVAAAFYSALLYYVQTVFYILLKKYLKTT